MSDILQVKWKRPRRALPLPELNQYPATPAGYYSGFYPGSAEALTTKRFSFDIHFRTVPEFNAWPATPAVNQYPAWFDQKVIPTNRTNRRGVRTPEHSNWPQTPVQQPITAWSGLRQVQLYSRVNRRSMAVASVISAAPTPALSLYPAFALTIRPHSHSFDIRALKTPEHNVYPAAYQRVCGVTASVSLKYNQSVSGVISFAQSVTIEQRYNQAVEVCNA